MKSLTYVVCFRCALLTKKYLCFHFSPKMSDEENDRFEEEQSLLTDNIETIPHTPSAWEQDIYDVDEDPDPHGKKLIIFMLV